MEALNYSREVIPILNRIAKHSDIKQYATMDAQVLSIVNDIANSQKFTLPVDGLILDDGCKGLPDKLMLPFDKIVLEFQTTPNAAVAPSTRITKAIIVATQVDDNDISAILIGCDSSNNWIPMTVGIGFTRLDTYDYIDSNFDTIDGSEIAKLGIHVRYDVFPGSEDYYKKHPDYLVGGIEHALRVIKPILELLEALSCSNVTYEKLPPTKLTWTQKRKGVKEFDSYNVLVIKNKSGVNDSIGGIGGSDTKKREHLRRGHIRICASGIKTWVQSCVVNAGIGGKVTKDYVLKK